MDDDPTPEGVTSLKFEVCRRGERIVVTRQIPDVKIEQARFPRIFMETEVFNMLEEAGENMGLPE